MNFIGFGGPYSPNEPFFRVEKNLKHQLFFVNYRVLRGFSSIPGSSLQNKPPSCVVLSWVWSLVVSEDALAQ